MRFLKLLNVFVQLREDTAAEMSSLLKQLEASKQQEAQVVEQMKHLEQQRDGALINMSVVQNAQTMTEKRRKQLERDLEKESNDKLEFERKLEKVVVF